MGQDDPDLFGYPTDAAHKLARRTDPHTSHEAAASVLPKLSELRRTVYELLLQAGPYGLTDYAIEEHLHNHGSTYRTRRAELVAMGLVEDAGITRVINGRARKVWRAVSG